MELSREDLIFSAYLSEEAEKYDDMLAAMTQLVHQHPVLTTAERNLLSVAFKNIIGHVRASHRIISSLEAKEMPQNNEKNIVRIQKYREKIENEIRHHIQTFLDIIENILIPNAPDPEAKVFYSKMQGDYWRYIAEIETNEAKKYATERSQNGYDTAFKFVESLSLLHPLRLGLCLNYSVFCYEILNDNVEQARALDRAQKVYRNILENLDNATEEEMRDLEPILRLIQNLPLFPNNMNREHEESRIDIDSGHAP